ncbi:MAG: TonB-dependent receptor family protein [Rhodothermales bacterium]
MRGFIRSLVVLMGIGLTAIPVVGQDSTDTSQAIELPPIEVEAIRSNALTSKNVPLAVTTLARSSTRRQLEPGLSLDEILSELPGLFISDRGNATLGERISIRGMGWRAAFGVRGVQILLDGIPLTMPDGQAVSDIVSPSMVEKAELIRGPSSLFWGNGSGGVLYLSSANTNMPNGVRLRAMGGSDGLRQFNVESNAQLGKNRFQLFVSDDRRDGYRDYSNNRFTRAALNGKLPLSNRSILTITSAFAYQDAKNPGSLTREQVDENPKLANARNLSTLAAKQSLQFQTGATLLHQTDIGELSAMAYGLVRDLDNPLSFTYIDLNRSAYGIRLALQNSTEKIGWGVGLDADIQDDDRRNVENDGGNPGTEVSLAQDENVRNISVYGFLNAKIAGPLRFTAGLRNDQVRFSMDDRFLDNGDQSGNRTFSALSPAVGFSVEANNLLFYTNYRSSFETPTTTELVNKPELDGGFNPDVDPQTVQGFEVGVRGNLNTWQTHFDVALYSMDVNDLLIPFQTEAGGDRTFYRNGGRNLHQGVELALKTRPTDWLSLQFTHTSGAFEFRSSDLRGNSLPGLPDSRTHIRAVIEAADIWIQPVFEHVSSFYANDDNSEQNDAYAVLDLTIGHKGIILPSITFRPFFRISNLSGETYNGSVVVNAFGSRYYEPAAGRTFQFGLNISV